MKHRPALFGALFLALGISVGASLPEFFRTVVPFALGAVLLLLIPTNYSFLRLATLALAFAVFGALFASLDWTSYHDTALARIAKRNPGSVALSGTLLGISETRHAYQWLFEADSLHLLATARAPNDPSVPVDGSVILRLPKGARRRARLPKSGTRLRVFSTLEPFHAATNPHEFASDERLRRQFHAEAQGRIASRFNYYLLEKPHSALFAGVSNAFDAAHRTILGLLNSAIRDNGARGFVEAVVLGDRNDMDKETLGDFTTSGVAHILAVSGFNVAIVALVVAQLLRLFGIYWFRTRTSITMAMVLLYAGIVGFQPSVVRALFMIELYLLAQLLERKPDPLNIVASAAAINLLLRPYDVFDVGFQLSYAGVLGMILIAPKLRWLFGLDEEPETLFKNRGWHRVARSRTVRELGTAAALSLGASIASYPIIATHFYRISFIGLAANLPLVPLSAFITALGFLLIPLTAVSLWLGQLYGTAAMALTNLLLLLTRLSAHFPHAAHAAAPPNWIFLSLLALAILYCIRSQTRPQLLGRMVLASSLCFALFELGVPFSNSVFGNNEGTLQVLFFDVGQGDCILVHTPSDKNYFIDFGKADYSGAAIDEAALPFLRAEDITASMPDSSATCTWIILAAHPSFSIIAAWEHYTRAASAYRTSLLASSIPKPTITTSEPACSRAATPSGSIPIWCSMLPAPIRTFGHPNEPSTDIIFITGCSPSNWSIVTRAFFSWEISNEATKKQCSRITVPFFDRMW